MKIFVSQCFNFSHFAAYLVTAAIEYGVDFLPLTYLGRPIQTEQNGIENISQDGIQQLCKDWLLHFG